MLAASNAEGPSVIQVRTQNVLPEAIGSLVLGTIRQFEKELLQGLLFRLITHPLAGAYSPFQAMKKGISTQGKTQIRCSRHSPHHGTHHPGKLAERLAALGVSRDSEPLPLEQLFHLSAADRRSRLIVNTFIHSSPQSGLSREEAIDDDATAYYINAYPGEVIL